MGKLAVAPVWKGRCWGQADIRFITRQIGDFDSAKADKPVPSHFFWKHARFLIDAGVRWPYTYLVGLDRTFRPDKKTRERVER